MHKKIEVPPYGAKTYSEILDSGLEYIRQRRDGIIKSIKTPWPSLNKAGVGGLEWNSLLTIAARPGAGKTMFVSQVLRECKILNADQHFNILEFQFEMGEKQIASRAFAAEAALDYGVILSTEKQLDEFSYNRLKRYVEDTKALEGLGVQRRVITTPLTTRQMEKAIHTWYNAMGQAPLIVTVDHSWLIKKDIDEKEKLSTLYNNVEMLMTIKRELPIIVLMISQLNRNIEDPNRKTPGSIGNYPTGSDVFGGDALQQGSDMLLVLSRPYTMQIQCYGPKEYMVDKKDIFVHILKSRNNSDDNNLVFLRGDFATQRMIETSEPAASNPTGNRFTPRRSGGTGRQRPVDTADIDTQ
jgi:replicative DNA helicase